MTTWLKILVVCLGGALSWGFAYSSTLAPDFAMVFASLASASTAGVGILVGWTPRT